MPRKRSPARLWIEKRPGRKPIWHILDKGRKISTGLFEEQRKAAEQVLAAYIESQHRAGGERSAVKVSVAEVLAYYVQEHVPTVARPDVIDRSIPALTEWWRGKSIADIKKSSCRRYVTWRTGKDETNRNPDPKSEDTARRDLVVLEAAVNFYHDEFILSAVPNVTKPPKAETSGDWITRSQAAVLLWFAWRRKKARHLARLILIMLYTGTRPGAALKLRWIPSGKGGWIDVENGRIYRRAQGAIETKKRQPSSAIHWRLLPHLRRWKKKDEIAGIDLVVHFYGEPILRVAKGWQELRKATGLPSWVIPYTCRHSAATWQMQAGTDLFQAAGLLGMSVEMLRKVYGHHHPDFQSEAAQATAKPQPRRMICE